MGAGRGLLLLSALLTACADEAPPPPCEDDPLGNGTRPQSLLLTAGAELRGLKICPGREDWYRAELEWGAELGVVTCMTRPNVVPFEFAAYREELGELYRHTNCGISGDAEYCQGTCAINAPGSYVFRVSGDRSAEYTLRLGYIPPKDMTSQRPPGFDIAPVLEPGIPRELTVCAPWAKFLQLQIPVRSTVTIQSTMLYSGYYLDFTVTDEGGRHLEYWPQGAGKTRRELPLEPGRYMLRIRSAHSFCRTFTLEHARVPR